jgi:pimeloyl-ACP methyl ester carboxylesterase
VRRAEPEVQIPRRAAPARYDGRAGFIIGLVLLAATHGVSVEAQSHATPPTHSRATGQSMTQTSTPVHAGYANVNGLRMYYELHGTEGFPLVLVHGGGSTITTTFGRILPLLARTHRVIAVEMQAHGHTRDIDRPFTFTQDADDIATLLDTLHVAKADVFGFSNGGTTALQVGMRHPAKVRRLIIASSNYKRDGMVDGFWEAMQKGTFADMPQIFKDELKKIDASEAAAHALFERDSKRMLAFKDIPDQEIKSILAPSLVIDGDRDVVRVEHAVELSRLLPHGRLCILPGEHGEYFGEISHPVDDRVTRGFVDLVDEFLGGQ